MTDDQRPPDGRTAKWILLLFVLIVAMVRLVGG